MQRIAVELAAFAATLAIVVVALHFVFDGHWGEEVSLAVFSFALFVGGAVRRARTARASTR